MPKDDQTMSLESQMILGYQIVLLHVFGCLNAKGVLPFSEAAQSLQETADILENVPARTIDTVRLFARTIEAYSAADIAADPTKPPPPTRLH